MVRMELLVNNTTTTKLELAFAAGILVGEGCVISRSGNVALGVSMLDHVAVERFAKAVSPAVLKAVSKTKRFEYEGLKIYYQDHKKGGTFARVWLCGDKAVQVCLSLAPYMIGTVKLSQMEQAFASAGLQTRLQLRLRSTAGRTRREVG